MPGRLLSNASDCASLIGGFELWIPESLPLVTCVVIYLSCKVYNVNYNTDAGQKINLNPQFLGNFTKTTRI